MKNNDIHIIMYLICSEISDALSYWQDTYFYIIPAVVFLNFIIATTNLLAGKFSRTVKDVVQLMMRQLTGLLEHLNNVFLTV